MYSRKKIIKMIDIIVPFLMEMLHMEDCDITFDVFHSKSKGYEELTKHYGKFKGLCFRQAKSKEIEIRIPYDRQSNQFDALGTIIHEVLHARLWPLVEQTKNSDKIWELEEDFVCDLENVLIATMFTQLRD